MSVAVAPTTQCAYCIESHTKNAVHAGATISEDNPAEICYTRQFPAAEGKR